MNRLRTMLAQLCNRPLWLFLALWCSIMLVYLPAYKAGFMGDFLGMYFFIDDISFWDFINRSNAEVKSFYQVTQLQLYAFIKMFGVHPLPWFILITGMHAATGLTIFTFFKKLFHDFRLNAATALAFCGTLLFLFNPNITEVTVWKGGYHYFTGIIMQLAICIWTLQYLHTGRGRYIGYALALFFISIFTLEIFYITPALVFALVLGYYWRGIIDRTTRNKALVKIFVPLIAIFLLHLLLFRFIYGSWIAHYGVTSTFNPQMSEMLPRVGKYLSTLLLLTGFWEVKARLGLYDWLSQPPVYYGLTSVLLLLAGAGLVFFKRLKAYGQLATFLLIATLLSLVLVVPIYFDDLFALYNSRRCYQPGIFIYLLVVVLLFALIRNKKLRMFLFGFYFLFFLFHTVERSVDWRRSTQVREGMLQNFHHASSDTLLLLNLPSYFKDIRIMPANTLNEFNKQLQLFEHDTIRGQLYEVSSYNMQHLWDGAHVTVLDSATLKVTLNQWGTWWLYNYIGASDYENDLYRFELTDPGHEYLIKLKRTPPNMTILYQDGLQWKQVNLNQRGEQW